jgi:hypothetical protein
MDRLLVRRLVSPRLRWQYADCFWIHCGDGQPHVGERVLPTGTADLVFVGDGRRATAPAVSLDLACRDMIGSD